MDSELESKDLWTRVKKVKGTEAFKSISQLKDANGFLTDNPVEISNILAVFFQGISSKDSLSVNQRIHFDKLNEKFDNAVTVNKYKELDEEFTMEELVSALATTKDSAPGPDGFKYKVYKNFSVKNKVNLLKLYNKVWFTGHRPKS